MPAKGSARCQDQMCLQRFMMQYMTKAAMLCHMYTHSNRCRILPQRCICAFSATMQNPSDDARISILSKHAGPMLHLSHSSHTCLQAMRHEQRRHRINDASVARTLRSAARVTSGPPTRMRDDGQHTNSNRDKPPSASTNFADDCCVFCHERHGCKGTAAKVNFVTQRDPNFGARFRPKKRAAKREPQQLGFTLSCPIWGP